MKKITSNTKISRGYLLMGTAVLCIISLFVTGCGYRLSGYGSQVPDHVRTIFIPDFDNQTTRHQVEQYVTFAIRDEFIRRSRLELADSESSADSMLEGKILSFEVVPVSYDSDASANVYRITLKINVRFIDLKRNQVIYESSGLKFSETYDIDPSDLAPGSDPHQFDTSDFFTQETGTLKEISEELAESIVTTILENF